MAMKNIANPLDGYFIDFNEDGTLSLVVYDKDNEKFEFYGKNGNLFDATVFDDEDEPIEMTLADMLRYSKDFFTDYLIEEETAQAIVNHLTPWFEKYAISEEDATLKRIEELKMWIDCRLKCIEERNKWIAEEREQIAKRIAESDRYINQRRDEIADLKVEIHGISQQIRKLKATLK